MKLGQMALFFGLLIIVASLVSCGATNARTTMSTPAPYTDPSDDTTLLAVRRK